MTRYVVLLRSVNVGGRRLTSALLSATCEAAGGHGVRTYIQSGNVVLDHAGDEATVASALRAAISAAAGFDVPVVVRTAAEWRNAVTGCPYASDAHLCALERRPPAEAAAILDRALGPGETYAIVGRDVHLHLPNGVGRSKLVPAVDRLGVLGTTRNRRTVRALADLLGPGDS